MSGPLRIAMLSDDYDPAATGVGIHVQILARELIDQGQQVVVITARHPGQSEREENDGLTVHRVRSTNADGHIVGTASAGQLKELLEREKIQLLHIHYFGVMMEMGLRAARKLGLPVVYTFHMGIEHVTQSWPLSWLKPVLAWKYKQMCRAVDQIIVPTPALKETLTKNDPELKAVEAITNPIVQPKAEGAAPEASKAFTVLFVGRLSPEKNLGMLLEAFALFHKQHPTPSRLVLVGQGVMDETLRRTAKSLGLEKDVVFAGQKSHRELGHDYGACDVFVLPSTFETQGMVAVEAMWLRKPVLVSKDIVSARELVTDGENGFLISSSDPADTAARLTQLAADAGLRQRLGDAGHARAQRYSPAGIAAQVLELYRKTMERTRRSP